MSKTSQRRETAYQQGYRDGQQGHPVQRNHKTPRYYRRGYQKAKREQQLRQPRHRSFDDEYID